MEIVRPPHRIALLTDFGEGPYVGQMQLVMSALAGATPVVPLVSDLPPFRPDLAAYMLPALMRDLPSGTLYLCVVDPGVGGSRGVIAARVGEDWLLAPDNGLLIPALRTGPQSHVYRIGWRPTSLSDSFHGRDLFAPLAARILAGVLPGATEIALQDLAGADWPVDAAKVCYVDRYGNVMSGMRAAGVDRGTILPVGEHRIGYARTFCEVSAGTAFWYENALGLLEIAVNQGKADSLLSLFPGDPLPIDLSLHQGLELHSLG
jgi:S-adenosylmethionine hydrolase